jgi:hypothetical protein
MAAFKIQAIGLLSGGYGMEELERAGAYRVYEDPAVSSSISTRPAADIEAWRLNLSDPRLVRESVYSAAGSLPRTPSHRQRREGRECSRQYEW